VEYNLARDKIHGPLDDLLNNQTLDGKKYLLSTAHWAIAPFSQNAQTAVVCYPDGTGKRITYLPGLTDESLHPAEEFTNKKQWEKTVLAQLTSSLHEFTFTPSKPSTIPSDHKDKWVAGTQVYGLVIGMGYNVHSGEYSLEKNCRYPSLYICSPVIDHATGDIDYVVLGITIPQSNRLRHMTTVYADEPEKESNQIFVYEVGGFYWNNKDAPVDEYDTYAPILSWVEISFKWVVTNKWIDGRKASILVPTIEKGDINFLYISDDDPHIPYYLKKESSHMKYVTPMIRPHVCNGFFTAQSIRQMKIKHILDGIFTTLRNIQKSWNFVISMVRGPGGSR
jgi:hypothetical protein